jgi:hypothetical protein
VHLPAPAPTDVGDDGAPRAFHPGDLVTARVVASATGYALAEAASQVTRTRAGLAAQRALEAGGALQGAPSAPSFLSPTLRRLPVVG